MSSSVALHPARASAASLWRPALGLAVIVLLGLGLAYSVAATLLGSALFPYRASGSLLHAQGKAVASEWVAQPFAGEAYFHARPSAANYDPMAAAGSNQARSNPDLQKRVADTAQAVAEREGIAASEVPSDLLTQSGSGLDPHISPRAAEVQVSRVAKARDLDRSTVEVLIERNTQAATFGVLGAPRVNVVRLNLALDALTPAQPASAQAQ